MQFISIYFLIFIVLLCICVKWTGNINIQNRIFFIANIVFYGSWNVKCLILLLAIVLVVYICGILYEKIKTTTPVICSVVVCVSVLGVFKYCNFFVESFSRLFNIENIKTLNLILPLGLSFYIFQAISYIVDVKRGAIPAEKSFTKLAAYLMFFAQITAGPIVKARDFLPQLNRKHHITKENVYAGMQQILLGITKKYVISDRIRGTVDAVYSMPKAFDGISISWAIIGYSIQIYCDFSGYSDMAIGIAKILDFDLGRNFDLPYLAENAQDFWRRWHISLSSWFKEYVYIPLGGSREGNVKTYRNLMITMLLSGLWHGANWKYVIWGGTHGVYSVLEKIGKTNGKSISIISRIVRGIITFTIVSILWVLFRADNMSASLEIVSGLIRATGIRYISVYTVIFTIVVFAWEIISYVKNDGHEIIPNMDLDIFRNRVIICFWWLMCICFAYVGNSTFVYAQF